MTRRNRGPRAGFTLVELLIVIAIIALLVALLIPAIGKVRDSARRAECATEMAQIANAVQTFKVKMNVTYIPAEGSAPGTGYFQLRDVYYAAPTAGQVGTNSPEAIYLKQVFPHLDLNPSTANIETGIPAGLSADLNPNQTLLFFLTGGVVTNYQGFSTNKQNPFTITSDTIGPFLEVKQTKALVDPSVNLHAHYLDPWGTPYAYFSYNPTKASAIKYSTTVWPLQSQKNVDGDSLVPQATAPVAGPGLQPYLDSNGKFLNAKSFQIISAGADRQFASGVTWTPGSGQWEQLGPGGDDMSNFNNGPLAAQE